MGAGGWLGKGCALRWDDGGLRGEYRGALQELIGGFVLAGGPCADLSRRIHVRTSLTLATKVSLVFDDVICIVFQRMLLSSSRVSVATTVQGPRVFSLNFHPRMSRPVSDEGRCRVDDVAGSVGGTAVLCGSSARNFLSNCSPSSSWVLDAGSWALPSAISCSLEVTS